MAHYLKRNVVCDKLRLKVRTSYALIGTAYGALISTDDILALLNRCRRAIPSPLEWMPADLATPDEMAAEPSLAESGITAHDLLNWARRTKNVAPHFRLSRQTIRFSRAIFLAWLDARSRLKTLKVRVA